MRQFRNFVLSLAAVLIMAQLVAASTASVTWIFSNGEVIDAGKFNTNFTDILNTINGNIDSDNITNGSLKEIDFGSEIITELSLKDNEISTALKDESILSGKIKDKEVKTADLDDVVATTAKIAIDAAATVYTIDEGTWSGGNCTGPVTMDVDGTRPTEAEIDVMKQSITAASVDGTDETLEVHAMALVTCTGNCTNQTPAPGLSCGYNGVDDTFIAKIYTKNHINSNGLFMLLNYSGTFTLADESPHNVYCEPWETDATSSSTWTYCARMIVVHHKR